METILQDLEVEVQLAVEVQEEQASPHQEQSQLEELVVRRLASRNILHKPVNTELVQQATISRLQEIHQEQHTILMQ